MTLAARPSRWAVLARTLLPLFAIAALLGLSGPASGQATPAGEAETGSESTAPPRGPQATTSDAESCLTCHRFPGLGRVDKESGELRLFFTSERYYAHAEGPHARLDCTQCHERTEVEVVPHEETTPVSCTQSCHVRSSTGESVQFSHALVAEEIEASVHSPAAIAELEFERPLLRDGQSSCLYCHDQPVFRDLDFPAKSHRGVSLATRCETCHDEAFPVDAEYYIQHTAGRIGDARPVAEAAQICATCHSDPALTAQMEMGDSISSYFLSFHGKASLLGSPETATCVDCHRTETGNVHRMLSKDDPESRTHDANLELTCRTAECHPNAVPDLTEAAVHLRLDPELKSAEYWLVLAFIGLIAFELTTYFGLALLELINAVVRRHDPHELRMVSVVRQIRERREGRRYMQRMTVNQRFQHWALVVTFTLLVLTGMPMRFADHPASQWLADIMGGIGALRVAHRVAGVGMFVVFGYHLLYLGATGLARFRQWRQANPDHGTLATVKGVLLSWPWVPTPTDVKQFVQMYLYLLGLRKERPHRGKYHFSQKIEYWAVFWGMGIIGVSGLMMWGTDLVPSIVGGRALNFAILVHSYEAFLAMMYIVIAHIYAVIFAPSVFPLSLGAMTGQSPALELVENHLGHVEDAARQAGVKPEDVPIEHPSKASVIAMRLYSLVLVAPVVGLGLAAADYLVEQTAGTRTVIEVAALPLRLDEASLTAVSEATGPGAARLDRYARGPLAHYHVIPTWYSPDPGSSCAGSGCHASLPHGERKESRAFLNMHSTFVECQVCHLDQTSTAEHLSWVQLDAERTRRDPPAVLQLTSVLAEPMPADEAGRAALNGRLKALLAKAVDESSGDPELERWLLQLETSRLGGPMHTLTLDEMRQNIYLHGHGEYGAKIGLRNGAIETWTMDAEQLAAAEALRADPDATRPEAERQSQVDLVHRGLKRPDVLCSQCHSDQPERIDFEGLGYATARASALRSNIVARQSEAVERGESFYLPALLAPVLEVEPAPTGELPTGEQP